MVGFIDMERTERFVCNFYVQKWVYFWRELKDSKPVPISSHK